MAKHNKQPQPCQREQEQLFLFPQLLAAPSSLRGAEVTAEFGLEGFGNIQKLLCLSQVKHTQTGPTPQSSHPKSLPSTAKVLALVKNPFLALSHRGVQGLGSSSCSLPTGISCLVGGWKENRKPVQCYNPDISERAKTRSTPRPS